MKKKRLFSSPKIFGLAKKEQKEQNF